MRDVPHLTIRDPSQKPRTGGRLDGSGVVAAGWRPSSSTPFALALAFLFPIYARN